jgi:hypothetical protein
MRVPVYVPASAGTWIMHELPPVRSIKGSYLVHVLDSMNTCTH